MSDERRWWACIWGHVFESPDDVTAPEACPREGDRDGELCGTDGIKGPFLRQERAEQVASGSGLPAVPRPARIERFLRDVADGRRRPEQAAEWASVWVGTEELAEESDEASRAALEALGRMRAGMPIEVAQQLLTVWVRDRAEPPA